MGAGEMVGAAASARVVSAPSMEAMVRFDLAGTLKTRCGLRCAGKAAFTASDFYAWDDIARDADGVPYGYRRLYGATCRDAADAMAMGDLQTAVEALAKLRDAESDVDDAVVQWALEVSREMAIAGVLS